jgi:hypothetical protein
MLRARSPPVAPASDAVPEGRPVHRLTAVRYFSRISSGSRGRQGTSASGAHPTDVSGSVISQA